MRSFGPTELFYILLAIRWTVVLFMGALIGGSILGAALALAGLSGRSLIRGAVSGLEQLVQGTPLLILLLLAYFGSSAVGFNVGALVSSVLTLALYAGAFLGTIWRAAIRAIPRGQSEACAALGLTTLQELRLVILPQAMRIGLPPTCGFVVQLIKNTSLASIVGFVELTRAGQLVSNATFQPLVSFGVVAALYFVMCLPFTLLTEWLEQRQAHLYQQ